MLIFQGVLVGLYTHNDLFYLHENPKISTIHAGKYTSSMDGMG